MADGFMNKRLVPIFIVVFVDLLGFSLILPLLPYYASRFAAAPQTIGYLIASYSLCQFLAAPFLGAWSDRVGRRPVLLYSQIGTCAGFVLMGLALHLPHPLAWLFVARIIDGVSGGNLTVAQAYITDVTEPKDRARSFGMIIGVSFGLGFLLGPTLGGFLSRFGYDVPAYAAAALSLASILATIFLLPETERQVEGQRPRGLAAYTSALDYLKLPELRRLLAIFFFMSLPFAMYVTMFALFADRRLGMTAEQAGYFLGFVGLMGIIWQGAAIGPFVKRFGDARAVLIGLAASALALLYLVLVDVWWKLIFVAALFSFGHSIARPALTSLITLGSPANRRGGVLGAMTSIESFARILAPVIGGWIIAFHPNWLGWLGGALFAVSAAIATTVASESAAQPAAQEQS